MATMYPSELSESFSAFEVSSERRVYDKLKSELDNSFAVFHDLKWDDPAVEDSHPVGQADFVIAHPEYGFLVLEVKGGRCSYQARTRIWQTTDRHGLHSQIKDPFDQAAIGARVLRKLLVKSTRAHGRRTIPLGQSAAIFPDCSLPKDFSRGDVPAWRVLDQENLFDLRGSIHTLFNAAFPENQRPARAEGLKLVDGLKQLWGSHDLQGRIRLDLRIKNSFARITNLTEQHLDILNSLRECTRLLVTGCAGSGKTTLAIHKARLLADEGKRVGFFCFNIPLAGYLTRLCEGIENITVGPFTELCMQWLIDAGIELNKQDTPEWWDDALPTLVFDHIDRIPYRFDAIVVDEGQDIRGNYWTAMEQLFSNPADPLLYIFADRAQNLYQGKMNLSIEVMPFSLNQNIRNTNQVFDVVKACCGFTADIKPSGVPGPVPQLYRYTDETDMCNQLAIIVERLCCESIPLGDIVILGTRSQTRSCLRHGERIGAFRLVETRQKNGDLVTMTVHKFKGLEASVIILCELDDQVRNLDELLYVGLTRSTGLVIALAQGDVHERLRRYRFHPME